MTECARYQFRLGKKDAWALEKAAKERGIAGNLMAKKIVQTALRDDLVSPDRLAEDLLIIRAGIEQLFSRSDRDEELGDAIERLRTKRKAARLTGLQEVV